MIVMDGFGVVESQVEMRGGRRQGTHMERVT